MREDQQKIGDKQQSGGASRPKLGLKFGATPVSSRPMPQVARHR